MDMEKLNEIIGLQKRWYRIRSANLYDTLDAMGYGNQCLDLRIKPIVPGSRIAGCAVTMRGKRAPYTKEELTENPLLNQDFGIVQNYAYPGSVIVVDSGGEPMSGKFGEMTSWALKQHGARGIVVDGFIRDYEGLLEIPDYTVCSRGTSPIESNHRWTLDDFNCVIGMPGSLTTSLRVCPGDWIVGDTDGIIVVPAEIAMEALIKAEDIENREEGMRQDISAGVTFSEAFKNWGRA